MQFSKVENSSSSQDFVTGFLKELQNPGSCDPSNSKPKTTVIHSASVSNWILETGPSLHPLIEILQFSRQFRDDLSRLLASLPIIFYTLMMHAYGPIASSKIRI